MNLNWLDVILIIIFLVTFLLGLIKGLVRQVIGILAVIGGIVLASRYYVWVSWKLLRFISSDFWRNCLSFMVVFIGVLLLGWLISFILTKLMKGSLSLTNHILGGLFGLLKGVLIGAVLVFGLLVFNFERQALINSKLAPVCMKVARSFSVLIPDSLKTRFEEAWKKFEGKGGWNEQKI
ncbi:MAG: CvpA family protein [Candidatus Saccharicenans sp.]